MCSLLNRGKVNILGDASGCWGEGWESVDCRYDSVFSRPLERVAYLATAMCLVELFGRQGSSSDSWGPAEICVGMWSWMGSFAT